jgi:mono/diheme cytochrome c family protein
MVRFGLVLLGAVMLGACGGGASSGGSGGGGSSGGEASYAGPITGTDAAHGETRYNAACASCHNNGAPVLANIGWTPERMRQQIREGGGDMPAIREERLSATDMEDLLAYLVSTGAVTP